MLIKFINKKNAEMWCSRYIYIYIHIQNPHLFRFKINYTLARSVDVEFTVLPLNKNSVIKLLLKKNNECVI